MLAELATPTKATPPLPSTAGQRGEDITVKGLWLEMGQGGTLINHHNGQNRLSLGNIN